MQARVASVSLTGAAFSTQHNIVLRAFCRAKRYDGDVWVSGPLVAMLNLKLLPHADPPISLAADNGTCLYHHSSQFALPLAEMQRRWQVFAGATVTADASVAPSQRLHRFTLDTRPYERVFPTPSLDSVLQVPLDTNGEPFSEEVHALMMAAMRQLVAAQPPAQRSLGLLSPYWAAEAEATFIFQSPFTAEFLRDFAHTAVPVPRTYCCGRSPILYYHVSGTVTPSVYTAANCRRYDPYNYCGAFYSPYYATCMKRFAVQHRCMHQPRWLTPFRIRMLGARCHRGAPRLTFYSRDYPLNLVNIALTMSPAELEKCCDHSTNDNTIGSSEDAELLVRTCVPTYDNEGPLTDAGLLP